MVLENGFLRPVAADNALRTQVEIVTPLGPARGGSAALQYVTNAGGSCYTIGPARPAELSSEISCALSEQRLPLWGGAPRSESAIPMIASGNHTSVHYGGRAQARSEEVPTISPKR